MFFDVYSQLCKSKSLTPNGAAKIMGFPSSSVTQWKKGSTPRPAALKTISEFFDVPVEFFISGEKEKSSTPVGAELDAETIQLREIWDTADQEEREALLAMARMLKARRVK